MRWGITCVCAGAVTIAMAGLGDGTARAEPYRLRADAFAEAPDPSGFLMVQASASERSLVLVDAEAMVWSGVSLDQAGDPEVRGEAVIAAVRIRDPEHGLGLRFGRLLYSGGAVRPLHIDGAVASARTPVGLQAEVFAGLPVAPGWPGRSFDWVAGGRATQSIGNVATAGVSYWQQRDEGVVAHSELGIEAASTPLPFFALSSNAAFDTDRAALVSARFSGILHDATNRLELFGLRRSPSLMLPATSLFAALGSFDGNELGTTGFYRVAPRLDLSATATVEVVAERPGATQSVRAELRLDDDGRGAVGVEGRRASMPGASWTGARAWLRLPLVAGLSASTEAEVAVPDEPAETGVAWPWVLVGLRYLPLRFLEAAGAVEISSTPAYSTSVGGLLRLSGTWSSP